MNNKFLYILISIFTFNILLSSDTANSEAIQETLNSVEEAEPAPFPSEVLTDKWTAKLERKGKYLNTLNSDKSLYVIGAASANKMPGDRGFTESKTNAFQRAELDAKMQIVRLMGETIRSGRGEEILENIVSGEDPDAKEKASKMQKASKIVDQSLDKALAYLGVSEEEIASMNEDKKEAAYQNNFNASSQLFAAQAIKGCAVVGVAEGIAGSSGYEMAVLMKFTPEFKQIADAMNSKRIYQAPKGKARNSLDKLRSLKPEQLILTHGSRVMFDNEGNPMVVGFGQVSYETGGKREAQNVRNAQTKARKNATVAIKNFIAEDMVVNEMSESVEKYSQYADGSENMFSQEKWELSRKGKETEVTLTGVMTLRSWRGVHPLTNETVAGTVTYWSMANRQMAEEIKKETTKTTSTPAAPKAKPERKTREGILDDDFFDDDE